MSAAADLEHEEIRGELRSLLRSVRALVEAHREAGSVGLPAEGDLAISTLVAPWPALADGAPLAASLPASPAASARPVVASPAAAQLAVSPAAAPASVSSAAPVTAQPTTAPAASAPAVAASVASATAARPAVAAPPSAPAAATPVSAQVAPARAVPSQPAAVPAQPSVAPLAVSAPPAVAAPSGSQGAIPTAAPSGALRPPVAAISEPVFPPLEPPTPPAQTSLFSTALPPPARGAVLPPDELRRRLAVVAERVAACSRCSLGSTRQKTVFARGNPESELCFIGEGSGEEEDAQGLPFVGASGQLLDKMIAAMGFGPDEVYIATIVKCCPPGNKAPTPEEMAGCIPYLHEQLDLIKPRVIVALGVTATRGLLGTHLGIKALRGTWKNYRGTIPLMPTYHPAYLLRDPAAKKDTWKDLQSVLERLGRHTPPRKTS